MESNNILEQPMTAKNNDYDDVDDVEMDGGQSQNYPQQQQQGGGVSQIQDKLSNSKWGDERQQEGGGGNNDTVDEAIGEPSPEQQPFFYLQPPRKHCATNYATLDFQMVSVSSKNSPEQQLPPPSSSSNDYKKQQYRSSRYSQQQPHQRIINELTFMNHVESHHIIFKNERQQQHIFSGVDAEEPSYAQVPDHVVRKHGVEFKPQILFDLLERNAITIVKGEKKLNKLYELLVDSNLYHVSSRGSGAIEFYRRNSVGSSGGANNSDRTSYDGTNGRGDHHYHHHRNNTNNKIRFIYDVSNKSNFNNSRSNLYGLTNPTFSLFMSKRTNVFLHYPAGITTEFSCGFHEELKSACSYSNCYLLYKWLYNVEPVPCVLVKPEDVL